MKDSVYRLVVDIWRLAAKFGFRKMGDDEWEDFVRSGQKLVIRYHSQGDAMEKLCRDMLNAIQRFYERKGTDG